jgi:hypothetical protein
MRKSRQFARARRRRYLCGRPMIGSCMVMGALRVGHQVTFFMVVAIVLQIPQTTRCRRLGNDW